MIEDGMYSHALLQVLVIQGLYFKPLTVCETNSEYT